MVACDRPLLVESDANDGIPTSFILDLMASGFNLEGIVMVSFLYTSKMPLYMT
jgi:hypothetical protein